MIELKLKNSISQGGKGGASSCCGGNSAGGEVAQTSCRPGRAVAAPTWATGTIMKAAGPVLTVSTGLSMSDRWEHFRCRTTAFRETSTVDPGLYAVGSPDENSDVLVSANYKFSFDVLRSALKGLNAWILVLDTKGINVWCAAGKGTFGTAELVKRLAVTRLDTVVSHKRLIVPQLGAVGVSAYKVAKMSGFRVIFGPVRAEDISPFIRAGYKATDEMRRVAFSLSDRLVLTPMEINPAMKKYYPLFALIVLVIFGLTPSAIIFRDSFLQGLPFLLLGLISVLAGAFLTPALLPFIPVRSFAVKGWLIGLFSLFLSTRLIPPLNHLSSILLIFAYLFFPAASSYIALQFTGSTTFTGMSGVKKELRIAIPVYVLLAGISAVVLIVFKLGQWGIL